MGSMAGYFQGSQLLFLSHMAAGMVIFSTGDLGFAVYAICTGGENVSPACSPDATVKMPGGLEAQPPQPVISLPHMKADIGGQGGH